MQALGPNTPAAAPKLSMMMIGMDAAAHYLSRTDTTPHGQH